MEDCNNFQNLMHKRHNTFRRLWLFLIGILLLTSGIILYLGYEGIISEKALAMIFSWQTLLIVLGVCFMIVSRFRFWFLPTVMIIIGIIFLLETNIGNFSEKIWAILLICFGFILLLKLIIPRHKKYYDGKLQSTKSSEQTVDTEDFIKKAANFSKFDIANESQNFRGGELHLVFSGGEIDLRKAQLADGINVLNIENVFSGVKIFVPADWDISFESIGVFGGINDKRKMVIYENINKSKKLIVKTEIVFGGGEILN